MLLEDRKTMFQLERENYLHKTIKASSVCQHVDEEILKFTGIEMLALLSQVRKLDAVTQKSS